MENVSKLQPGSEQGRALRKIQAYWAILNKAGFPADENRLREVAPKGKPATEFNPGFNQVAERRCVFRQVT